MASIAYQPMGFDLSFWQLWRKKCLEACRRAYAPEGELARNVALGPKDLGRRRPRADGVLLAPSEVILIQVKRRPRLADLDQIQERARLLSEHPRWPHQPEKPVRPLIVARTLDLHVAQAAQERGITLHQAGPDGRLLDLPQTWARRAPVPQGPS